MKKTRVLGTLTLVLACLALAFLTDLPQFLKYKKGDIKDFETVAAGELKKGDLVQGTIDLTEGCIAEMETTNKTMGITTSKRTSSQYYAVYMYNDQCILYETGNSSQWSTLDRMADEYIDYLTSYDEVFSETGSNDISDVTLPVTTMDFTGEVVEMSSDLEAIFREWYGDDAAYAQEAESVVIKYSDYSRFSWIIYVGIGAAAAAIAMLIVTIITWRREKNNQQFSY